MPSVSRAALGAALVAIATTGCGDFLTGKGISNNPNAPSEATRDQLFVGIQSGQFALLEGAVPQTACMWMQQCSGTGGRVFEATGTNYSINSTSFTGDFTQTYVGGGLIDERRVQASATADGDSTYLGIAKIWEAITMSFAADVWGDVPYREAAGDNPTPAYDPQLQIYDDLETLLDQAIAELQGGEGDGPGVQDLVYGGDRQKWIALAYTLKARIYLHTVEVRGNGEYATAIAAATNGISASSNDFRTFHTTATTERNMWNQFYTSSFGPDVVAGAFLANLMNTRSDPRRAEYFGTNGAGGYGGNDVNSSTPPNQVSPLNGTRNAPDYRQPLITWAENQLILAEANLQTNGQAAAQPYLDAVRSALGLGAVPATLPNIILEKYVALFQTYEPWNDYKRTCLPALDPARSATEIPGRLYYGSSEASANPNTPSTADQSANGGVAGGRTGVGGFRNPNDPSACP